MLRELGLTQVFSPTDVPDGHHYAILLYKRPAVLLTTPTTREPLRVLVVEDMPDLASSMERWLVAQDYTVQTADNGVTALEVFEEFHPGVVLLDIGLPAMDGWTVGSRMRQLRPTVTIIGTSGYDRDEDRQRATTAGFDYYFVKPLNLSMLAGLLHNELELVEHWIATDETLWAQAIATLYQADAQRKDVLAIEVKRSARTSVDVTIK